MTMLSPYVIEDFATGLATGVAIPAHPEALHSAGTEFLTRAFQAYGSLSHDNAVTRIARFDSCLAGNSGEKLFLSVEYATPDPALDTDLFVKFSRCPKDSFRDRRKHEFDGEVRLAALSRHPAFPVAVAKPYFADFDPISGTGILISARIDFGANGIEPVRAKCMDHRLTNPLEHYQATIRALARLAAAHQSGRLSPQVEMLFPFDSVAAAADMPIPWNGVQLTEKLAAIATFVRDCPQLFPASITDHAFLSMFERDALRFLKHEAALRHFLHADPRLIALTHWNTNIDNAWFWRDAAGILQCGLLDWGMVRTMNVTYGIWGGLSAADPSMLEGHLDDLLALYAAELTANGGAKLDADRLGLHFDLSLALLGLALMMDVPSLVQSRLADVVMASSTRDPLLHADPVAHGFLHVFVNFLMLWAKRNFGKSLDRMLGL